jgi:hypothetical protein
MEDRSLSPAKSSDNSDGKDHTRASTELTLRSDRNYVIQPKNIKLNEMFILQSLKNQLKRKFILDMMGRRSHSQLKIQRKTTSEKILSYR